MTAIQTEINRILKKPPFNPYERFEALEKAFMVLYTLANTIEQSTNMKAMRLISGALHHIKQQLVLELLVIEDKIELKTHSGSGGPSGRK